jgi:small subunit ribosomal protein S12
MPTINQLVRKKRVSKKINLNKTPALYSNPQKHGTCLSVFTKTPRKPNSAIRKVAKVRLVNSRIITVYIPGEGHNISRFSDILISGRRIRDLPGVKYGAIRGKFDLSYVEGKRNGRSKYGRKKEKLDSLSIEKTKRKGPVWNRLLNRSLKRIYLHWAHSGSIDRALYRVIFRSFFYFNALLFNVFTKDLGYYTYLPLDILVLLDRFYKYRAKMIADFKRVRHPYKLIKLTRGLLSVKNLDEDKIYTYDLLSERKKKIKILV